MLVTVYSPLDSVLLSAGNTSEKGFSSETLDHSTCGRGRPDTLQDSSTRLDCLTVWLVGGTVMVGAAAHTERVHGHMHIRASYSSPCASNMKNLVSVAVPSVMVLEAVQLYSPESEN